MTEMLMGVALFLLLFLVAGMVRVLRGPTAADRMITAQLFGTIAVAILLLIGVAADVPAIIDVALVMALLSVVAVVAFVRLTWNEDPGDDA